MTESRPPRKRHVETPPRHTAALVRMLTSAERFSRGLLRRPLRAYQVPIAQAIVDSILQRRGLTFAVMMARQAGKNELSAHIEALLLSLFQRIGGSLVKAAPTFRPQTVNSLLRLRGLLERYPLQRARCEQGYILRLGRARAFFLSAAPQARVVGATATLLLEADEAQDLDEDKWNKDFAPMAASANATTVLWGTAWTADTLLARAIRALRQLEAADGVQRVFVVPWEEVAAEVPPYGDYVRAEVARLGADHPLVRSQYRLEEIAAAGGMFPAATRVLMQGTHPRQRQPAAGREVALLLDVAGEAEERLGGDPARRPPARQDATALTVVALERPALGLPRFLVLDRYLWLGTPHHQLYGAILHLAELWAPTRVVVDATGLGAGLASFLRRALGERVLAYTFSAQSKSDLGWGFLGICSSGRFQDYCDDGGPEWAQFWREVAAADLQIVDGPQKLMRWGVPDPAVHDDLLISAALCAALDRAAPSPGLGSLVIEAEDPLDEVAHRRRRPGDGFGELC
jgi:hypothetical protein